MISMEVGEVGYSHVCFQNCEEEKIIKNAQSTRLDPIVPNPDPDPAHRTLSAEKPDTFFY